jgi:hypothetical protein
VHRLLTRAAEAVDRRPRHIDREARREHAPARDVEPLLTHRRNAAEDHVVDKLQRDLRMPFHQARERVRSEVHRVRVDEAPLLLPAR